MSVAPMAAVACDLVKAKGEGSRPGVGHGGGGETFEGERCVVRVDGRLESACC